MKHLRQYIRNIMLEIYDLTPEEQEKSDEQWSSGGRRIFGLQSREEQVEDRERIKRYQNKLHSSPKGKALIKSFQAGRGVNCVHSIFGYVSFAEEEGVKGTRIWPLFSSWVKKYGRKGKDMLSCVAHAGDPGSRDVDLYWQNAGGWYSCGWVMKGFPVIVSKVDVDSQTLGVIPDRIVQQWKSSGIPKRPNEYSEEKGYIQSMEELESYGGAGEVLLDNWEINGVWINLSAGSPRFDNSKFGYTHIGEAWLDMYEDAMKQNLPIYVYSGDNFLGKDLSLKEFEEAFRKDRDADYGDGYEWERKVSMYNRGK